MKEEIKFHADGILNEAIRSWHQWLLDERRYSVHTVDAYARDLALFTAFLAAREDLCPEGKVSLGLLKKLKIRDFRSFIGARSAGNKEKAPLPANFQASAIFPLARSAESGSKPGRQHPFIPAQKQSAAESCRRQRNA